MELKKMHRSCYKTIVRSDSKIFKNVFGNFCLYSQENGVTSLDQLELMRRYVLLKTKKLAKVWFLFTPQHSVSKKNLGIRMGSGKGSHSHFIYKVRKGDLVIAFGKVGLSYLLRLVKIFRSFLSYKIKLLYYV